MLSPGPCFNGAAVTTTERASPKPRPCLVTGGAGFIGCNLSDRLVTAGWDVTVLDDLSRPGSERNLARLRRDGDDAVRFVQADIRDPERVLAASAGVDVVFHLAGQTAVTTSIADPRADFESNAVGTLNVLEAARRSSRQPTVVYASTNKVYGSLAHVPVSEGETRYRFLDLPLGIDERQPLDPQSPYACSKAAGDQYTLDYSRTYGLRTVVFRQSCIYGPRQLGSEEQGWVAWLASSVALGREPTIFGSGKQLRDLLHVDDLVDAYLLAVERIDAVAGNAYNVGGGPERTLSVWAELGPLLASIIGRPVPDPRRARARPGDQRVFVSDVRRAAADLGWHPRTGVREGVEQLVASLLAEREATPAPARP
jgi:CDP-paratose 2-epimerase